MRDTTTLSVPSDAVFFQASAKATASAVADARRAHAGGVQERTALFWSYVGRAARAPRRGAAPLVLRWARGTVNVTAFQS